MKVKTAFKRGVNRNVTTATAFWMGVVAKEYSGWWLRGCIITSAYRPGDPGAHGKGEAWDIRRVSGEDGKYRDSGFCQHIQLEYGKYIGVVLEPEWGKGKGYTAPHMHFQLKSPARRMFDE